MGLLRLSLAVSFLLLAGCASQVAELRADLERAPLCCADLESIQYRPLTLDKNLTFDMNEPPQVRQFGAERSYFQAFALPPGGRLLLLRSRINERWIGGLTTAHVFRPVILLLDADKHLFSEIHPHDLAWEYDFWWGYHLFVPIDLTGPERYVIIYTDAAQLAVTTPYFYGATAGVMPVSTGNGTMIMVPTGGGNQNGGLPAGASGSMIIEVTSKAPVSRP